MKHDFNFCPVEDDHAEEKIVLTGQNSDMLFHIDHHAPSSFTSGAMRVVKMVAGIKLRFRTTVLYYTLRTRSKNSDASEALLPGVVGSYTGLSEHGSDGAGLPSPVSRIVEDYKHECYVLPLTRWYQSQFYPVLKDAGLGAGQQTNHAVRIARWLRTIGSVQQSFMNAGTHENLAICTPFSEGPVAVELLTYRLGIRDALAPKRFLHSLIRSHLGTSYSKVREQVLGGGVTDLPWQVVRYGVRSVRKLTGRLWKSQHHEPSVASKSRHTIQTNDLRNLRDTLGHQDGVVNRPLLNCIEDDACKDYLNHLYDCLELKVDPVTLGKTEGMQLCRLVNLQVMLGPVDEEVT